MNIATGSDILSDFMANQSTIIDLLTNINNYFAFLTLFALGICILLVLVNFCRLLSKLIGF